MTDAHAQAVLISARNMEVIKNALPGWNPPPVTMDPEKLNDPFLGTNLKNHIPHLEIIDNCDHSPEKMLEALTHKLQWSL